MPQPEALNTRIRRSDLISVDCCPNKSPAPTNPQQNILQRPLLTGSIITVILNKPKLITVVCCVDQWNNSAIFTVGLCCADICAEATTVKSMTSTMTTQPDYFQHKKLLNKVNLKSETKTNLPVSRTGLEQLVKRSSYCCRCNATCVEKVQAINLNAWICEAIFKKWL